MVKRTPTLREILINRKTAALLLAGCSLLALALLLYLQTPRGRLHLLLLRIDRQLGPQRGFRPQLELSYMLRELLEEHPSFESILRERLSNPDEEAEMRAYLLPKLWDSLSQAERMSYLEEFLKSRKWHLFAEATGFASELRTDFNAEEKKILVSLIEEGVEEGFASYSPSARDLFHIERMVERLQPAPAATASPSKETQGGLSESQREGE